jgi:hypothetical protein
VIAESRMLFSSFRVKFESEKQQKVGDAKMLFIQSVSYGSVYKSYVGVTES